MTKLSPAENHGHRHPQMPTNQGRNSSTAEDSRRWREVAKNSAAQSRIINQCEGSSLAQMMPSASKSAVEVPE